MHPPALDMLFAPGKTFPSILRRRVALRLFYSLVIAVTLPDAYGGSDGKGRTHVPAPLTLEAAYDRALSNDESIGVALQELRNSGLQPLSALVRLAPQLTGSVSAGRDLTNSGGGSSTVIVNGLQSTTTTSNAGSTGTTTGTGTTGTGTTATTGTTGTSTGSVGSISTVSVATATNANGSVSLNLQQPLFDASVFPAYRSAKLSLESSRLSYASTVRDIL